MRILTDHQREMLELNNCRRMRGQDRLNRPWYPEDVPQPEPEPPQSNSTPLEWDKAQWEQVKQLRGMVDHLQNKIIEYRKERPFKGKYHEYV